MTYSTPVIPKHPILESEDEKYGMFIFVLFTSLLIIPSLFIGCLVISGFLQQEKEALSLYKRLQYGTPFTIAASSPISALVIAENSQCTDVSGKASLVFGQAKVLGMLGSQAYWRIKVQRVGCIETVAIEDKELLHVAQTLSETQAKTGAVLQDLTPSTMQAILAETPVKR